MKANVNAAYDHVPTEEIDGGKWREQAACAGEDGDLWFPAKGANDHGAVAQAQAICRTCPVKAQCLAYALTNHINHGLWGGLTVRERRNYRRTHRMPASPPRRPVLVLQPEDWSTMAQSPYSPTQRTVESDG